MRQQFNFIVIIILFLYLVPFALKAQNLSPDSLTQKVEQLGNWLLYRNHDTNYIKNYGDEVAVKLILINKYNYFKVKDRINNTGLHYRPVRDLSFGVGVSYKWFALDLTFSLGLRNRSEFKNSKAFDFQGRIFSSRQYTSVTLQYYYGYKLTGSTGIDNPITEEIKNREDIRTINFGLQYLYAFNCDRFSLKAPFIFNEVQRKSAGSLIGGAGFNIFIMDADSSIIPNDVINSFKEQLYLRDVNVISVVLSFGYMYSLIYKEHFFLTLGLIPGLSLNFGDYLTDYRSSFKPNATLKINTMNAIGYNGRNFFGGIQFIGDFSNVRIEKKLNTRIGYGRFGFFAGYRF